MSNATSDATGCTLSTTADYCQTSPVTWSYYQPTPKQDLFRLELDDLYRIKLVPLTPLARTIAKAWGDRAARFRMEYQGQGPDKNPMHSDALQSVFFDFEPVNALTSDRGVGHTIRLSDEKYFACRDLVTKGQSAQPIPDKPARRRPARRKRTV